MIGINIVSVVVLLGVLIFVHELGHFLVAKASGVSVLKFSLGFGPRLIGRKWGETEYMISAVPLGGYVKMLGESGSEQVSEADRHRSFSHQPVIKRIGIVFSGPLFNFLFAVVAFALINMVGVPVPTSQVGGVQEGSAAAQAGIVAGDRIVSIDGKKVSAWPEIARFIENAQGKQISLKIDRGGIVFEVKLAGRLTPSKNVFGEDTESYKIGVQSSAEIMTKRLNPLAAAWAGIEETWKWTKLTCLSVIKLIQGVIPVSTLGGPILIAEMAGQTVKHGILPFVLLMAILSINLGVLNLLPIPVLDGGHLFFFLIELVTGHEINLKWRELAQQVGFMILIILMLFVFYNDIKRIFSD